jgi:trehalose 6-phosphate synthase
MHAAGRTTSTGVADSRRRRWPLVVVANTLPIRRLREQGRLRWVTAPGGLASALTPIVRQSGGAWVGWNGTAGRPMTPSRHDGIAMVTVPLSRQEVATYYEGFSNGSLWPLFHGAIRQPEYHRPWWAAYRVVNERFAAAAARVAEKGAAVWVQDYHLLLVPALLRLARPDLRIGFFLHIPFPSEDLFMRLPWRQEIIDGMLGADVIGFQTPVAARNFARLSRRYGGTTVHGNALHTGGRVAIADAFPISVDVERFESAAALPAVRRRADELRRRVARGRRVLLGVDRLDYTKGIDLRLKAYEELFRRDPEAASRTVLVQVAVPSRERVGEYRRLQQQVDALIGRLNGEYGDVGIQPVDYVRRHLPFEELVAMYQFADVMLVTPLADGMNLVAKEFVACRPNDTGVLVLSEFAGAASEFRTALLVNPHDVNGTATAIGRALTMTPREQRRRMRAMQAVVHAHTLSDWAGTFLAALTDASRGSARRTD